MKSQKTAGIILLVLGGGILILSLVADLVGIGGSPGLGPYQIIGILVGTVAAVVGLVLTFRK